MSTFGVLGVLGAVDHAMTGIYLNFVMSVDGKFFV